MYSVKAHLSWSGRQAERSIRFILHAHRRSHYIVMSKYWIRLLYDLKNYDLKVQVMTGYV